MNCEGWSNKAGLGSADRATSGGGKMGLRFVYTTVDGDVGAG